MQLGIKDGVTGVCQGNGATGDQGWCNRGVSRNWCNRSVSGNVVTGDVKEMV